MRFISHWDSKEAEARSTRWRHVIASFLYSIAASRASMASSSWNNVLSSWKNRLSWRRGIRLPEPQSPGQIHCSQHTYTTEPLVSPQPESVLTLSKVPLTAAAAGILGHSLMQYERHSAVRLRSQVLIHFRVSLGSLRKLSWAYLRPQTTRGKFLQCRLSVQRKSTSHTAGCLVPLGGS